MGRSRPGFVIFPEAAPSVGEWVNPDKLRAPILAPREWTRRLITSRRPTAPDGEQGRGGDAVPAFCSGMSETPVISRFGKNRCTDVCSGPHARARGEDPLRQVGGAEVGWRMNTTPRRNGGKSDKAEREPTSLLAATRFAPLPPPTSASVATKSTKRASPEREQGSAAPSPAATAPGRASRARHQANPACRAGGEPVRECPCLSLAGPSFVVAFFPLRRS